MGHVTVFSGPERRRRWSNEERRLILTEAFSRGACVAAVARRHDVSTALLYTWRRKLLQATAEPDVPMTLDPGFAEARILDDQDGGPAEQRPAMIIDLTQGKRVSIFVSASPAQVASALKALR